MKECAILGSHFWKEAFKTWIENRSKKNNINIQSTYIWNNDLITYRGNVLFYKNWIQNGIIRISDLLENEHILSFEQLVNKIGNSPSLQLEYNVVRNAIYPFLNRNQNYNNLT